MSPPAWSNDDALIGRIEREVFAPTLRGLAAEGIDYRGVLFAGLMIDAEGQPWMLEYNCRFGDPETQPVLARWRGDLAKRLMADARIPPRFSRAELDTFEHDMDTQRAAWRKATAFVDSFPVVERGLLFYGPHGVGKTHLAVGILKACIRAKGARAFFFETRELLRLVRDTYNRSVEETEMEVLQPLLAADLLVLDDLGAERTSDWVQETLGLVVNTRYNAKRPTIFTSNLIDSPDNTDPRSFTFQLGARTRSRLMEMCDWIEIQGADVREVGPDATFPGMGESYCRSLSVLRGLNPDIFLAPHGSFIELDEKLERLRRGDLRAFVDPDGYGAYLESAAATIERTLAEQGHVGGCAALVR